MALTVFTLGYQGLSLAEYIALLKERPIVKVVDVRAVAWSRKPGFTKEPMRAGLKEAGLEYLHLQSAGNPFRKDTDGDDIMTKYKGYLARNPGCLDAIEAEIQQ